MNQFKDFSSAVSVERVSAGGEKTWDDFVREHPNATMCHLYSWKRVFASSYGWDSYYLMARRYGEVEGVLPLVLMRTLPRTSLLISIPYLDQGGPLASSSDAAAAMWKSALGLAAQCGAGRIDLRGPQQTRQCSQGEPLRMTLMLSLPATREALWRQIGSKVRNQIRKSEKCHLQTRAVPPEDLGRFYAVYAHNMSFLGSPAHSQGFFAAVLREFESASQLYLTEDKWGRAVAAALALRFRDTVVVPWASALPEARPWCPNHSLYWQVLVEAVEGGTNSFDFGRSEPGSGTHHFKKQWGTVGRPLDWESYDRRGRPQPIKHLSASSHPLLVSAWKRLPKRLAAALGPGIRARLPN